MSTTSCSRTRRRASSESSCLLKHECCYDTLTPGAHPNQCWPSIDSVRRSTVPCFGQDGAYSPRPSTSKSRTSDRDRYIEERPHRARNRSRSPARVRSRLKSSSQYRERDCSPHCLPDYASESEETEVRLRGEGAENDSSDHSSPPSPKTLRQTFSDGIAFVVELLIEAENRAEDYPRPLLDIMTDLYSDLEDELLEEILCRNPDEGRPPVVDMLRLLGVMIGIF